MARRGRGGGREDDAVDEVHTAALVSFRGDARRFWEVNVLGTATAAPMKPEAPVTKTDRGGALI